MDIPPHASLREVSQPDARPLQSREFWIFDMDGTLTQSVHDFDAIRNELGVPHGQPILEYIDTLEQGEATRLHQQLFDIEMRHVSLTDTAGHAQLLLDSLVNAGKTLGIVTRNANEIAVATLEHCGLSHYFGDGTLIAREDASPKPDPSGILKLLSLWRAKPSQAVMIGDYHHDLHAGRNAGTATVYIDQSNSAQFSHLADLTVTHLGQLIPHIE